MKVILGCIHALSQYCSLYYADYRKCRQTDFLLAVALSLRAAPSGQLTQLSRLDAKIGHFSCDFARQGAIARYTEGIFRPSRHAPQCRRNLDGDPCLGFEDCQERLFERQASGVRSAKNAFS